jgi:hypothetical protein
MDNITQQSQQHKWLAYGLACLIVSLMLALSMQARGQNNALHFDGSDDNVSVPHFTQRNFGTGDFTTECWFNYGTSQPKQYPSLLSWRASTSDGCLLFFDNSTHRFWIQIASVNYTNVSPTVNDGLWHHVALVRASGVVTLYLVVPYELCLPNNTKMKFKMRQKLTQRYGEARRNTEFFV